MQNIFKPKFFWDEKIIFQKFLLKSREKHLTFPTQPTRASGSVWGKFHTYLKTHRSTHPTLRAILKSPSSYKNSGKLLKINVTSSRIPQAQFLIFRDRFLDKVYAPIYGARIMIRIEFSKIRLGYKTTYSKRYVHDFSASGKQYGALSEHHSNLCILANFVTFATHPNGIHHV